MRRSILALLFITVLTQVQASDTMTIRQIFNYDVDDTFDYKITASYNASPSSTYFHPEYMRFRISSKIFSLDSETVTYTRYKIYPPTGTTDTMIYSFLDSSILYLDTALSGFDFYTGFDSSHRVTNTEHFLRLDGGTTQIFTEGLGKTYVNVSFGALPTDPYGHNDTSLIYYSKGSIQRGIPYYQDERVDVSDISLNPIISIHPNPVNTHFTLLCGGLAKNDTGLILANLLGQEVYYSPILESKTTHDISSLPGGIYTWRLYSDNTILKTGKIVKQ